MKVLLAKPRGFCAGVDRAITIVERLLEEFGPPIYVRHEVVHNRTVVNDLKSRGAVFVDELSLVPNDSTVVFSAHGVSQDVRAEAKQRQLNVFDATCPLVTKVHMEVARYARKGYEVILIGHAGHPEVEGTMGQYHYQEGGIYLVETSADVSQLTVKNEKKLAYVSQTTLSVDDTKVIIDALRERFPTILGPRKDDICYATQNRQDAVKVLAEQCDVVLVVGSQNSSNSNRLREIASRYGALAYLIDRAAEIQPEWLQNIATVGVTAGASAPEVLVQEVATKLKQFGGHEPEELAGEDESVVFVLPRELRKQRKKGEMA